MSKLLEIIDIIKLALIAYKKMGYEVARQRLVKEIEAKDDKRTEDELHWILD